MDELDQQEERLLTMAAQLLQLALRASQKANSQETREQILGVHKSDRLYPRLVISAPHEGGSALLDLAFYDPETDEKVVHLMSLEGKQEITPQ